MGCEGEAHQFPFPGFERPVLEGDSCACGKELAPIDFMWPEEWTNILAPKDDPLAVNDDEA
jgi:hypothetical protein